MCEEWDFVICELMKVSRGNRIKWIKLILERLIVYVFFYLEVLDFEDFL